jgi:hypothetical protein
LGGRRGAYDADQALQRFSAGQVAFLVVFYKLVDQVLLQVVHGDSFAPRFPEPRQRCRTT